MWRAVRRLAPVAGAGAAGRICNSPVQCTGELPDSSYVGNRPTAGNLACSSVANVRATLSGVMAVPSRGCARVSSMPAAAPSIIGQIVSRASYPALLRQFADLSDDEAPAASSLDPSVVRFHSRSRAFAAASSAFAKVSDSDSDMLRSGPPASTAARRERCQGSKRCKRQGNPSGHIGPASSAAALATTMAGNKGRSNAAVDNNAGACNLASAGAGGAMVMTSALRPVVACRGESTGTCASGSSDAVSDTLAPWSVAIADVLKDLQVGTFRRLAAIRV